MMKFHTIDLKIGTSDEFGSPEVRLLFSRTVRDVRMTANEAERHAYEILEQVKKVRQLEETSNAGIDSGFLTSR